MYTQLIYRYRNDPKGSLWREVPKVISARVLPQAAGLARLACCLALGSSLRSAGRPAHYANTL